MFVVTSIGMTSILENVETVCSKHGGNLLRYETIIRHTDHTCNGKSLIDKLSNYLAGIVRNNEIRYVVILRDQTQLYLMRLYPEWYAVEYVTLIPVDNFEGSLENIGIVCHSESQTMNSGCSGGQYKCNDGSCIWKTSVMKYMYHTAALLKMKTTVMIARREVNGTSDVAMVVVCQRQGCVTES